MNMEIPPAVMVLANKLAMAEAACAVLAERVAVLENQARLAKEKADTESKAQESAS